jgi:hypothetical protein
VSKPSFTWEITAGHIMQAMVMLLTAAVIYGDSRAQRERNAARTDVLELSSKDHDQRIAAQEANSHQISVAIMKLTTLIEERTGPRLERGKPFIN